MKYYNKYLKYKIKYLKYKKIGGLPLKASVTKVVLEKKPRKV